MGNDDEEENKFGDDEEESSDGENEFPEREEDNKISQKHAKHTTLEERDREDMDFPDEVDTPFKEARKRF